MDKQYTLHILSVCLYSCHNYPACKAHVPYYTVICDLSGCTIFFQIFSQMVRFFDKVIEHKMCILIFSTPSVRKISNSKNSAVSAHTGFHVKYPLLLGFNENWIFLTDFQKIHTHHTSWKSVQWESSYSMGTDITNQQSLFLNFTNLPKIPYPMPLLAHHSNCVWSNKISTNFFNTSKISHLTWITGHINTWP